MKINLISLLTLVLINFSLKAQTNVSGFINANTTWNSSGSPYIVTGNALLSNGYTLTIEPGVTIKFNPNTALQIDGELIAIGNSQNRITFTSNQAIPQSGDWGKLHISDLAVDAVYNSVGEYTSGSILKYCDVLFAGSLGYGAIQLEGASPYISQISVQQSSSSGIYCSGSSYSIDSSLVSNCAEVGLYFDQVPSSASAITIRNDSILNNFGGGISFGVFLGVHCPITIENNYFISNAGIGAITSIDFSWAFPIYDSVQIKNNYFIRNSGSGTVYFSGVGNIRIIQNHFLENVTAAYSCNGTVTLNLYGNALIAENYFERDTLLGGYNICSSHYYGKTAILTLAEHYSGPRITTIECNQFIKNVTDTNNAGVIYLNCQNYQNIPGSASITNNIIDGNVNNSLDANSCVYITSDCNDTIKFNNNTIKNNIAPNGSACYFNPYLTNNDELLSIYNNNFAKNEVKNVIFIDGQQINNINYNFMYMENNNFLDINTVQLYNNIPFGSPNIYAPNNWWGSTDFLHIDSIIYDYFDFANYSVVYYNQVLTTPVKIDNNCYFVDGVDDITQNTIYSNIFPNPFSEFTQIQFSREIINGSLNLYDVLGRTLFQVNHFSSNTLDIARGDLSDGIYFLQILENGKKIGAGKVVVGSH